MEDERKRDGRIPRTNILAVREHVFALPSLKLNTSRIVGPYLRRQLRDHQAQRAIPESGRWPRCREQFGASSVQRIG